MMNRSEFMFQLAQLLADLSQAERSEALKYYQDYFDDAGPENEARIIEELVSPEAVAASIKAGLSSEESDKGEFSERGFSSGYDEPFDAPGKYSSSKSKFWQVKDEAQKKMNDFSEKVNDFSEKYAERFKNAGNRNTRQRTGEYRYGANYGEGSRSGQGSASENRNAGEGQESYGGHDGNAGYDSYNNWENYGSQNNGYGSQNGSYGGYEYQDYGQNTRSRRRRFSGGQIVLIVLLAICASPILLGIFGGAVGIVFGVIGTLVALAAGLIGTTVGFVFGGIGGFISGAIQCFSNPASGITTCGISLIMIAVGALLLIVDIWFVTKPLPAFFRWLRSLWRRIFHRREQNI